VPKSVDSGEVEMNVMRSIKSVLAIVVVVSIALATAASAQEAVPVGWAKSGTDPSGYEMTLDKATKHSGTASACIQRLIKTTKDNDFATLMQTFGAVEFIRRSRKTYSAIWEAL
jgi:hypothetical protein